MGNTASTCHASSPRPSRFRWLVSIVRIQKPIGKKQSYLGTTSYWGYYWPPRPEREFGTCIVILCPSFFTFKEVKLCSSLGYRLLQFKVRWLLFDDFAMSKPWYLSENTLHKSSATDQGNTTSLPLFQEIHRLFNRSITGSPTSPPCLFVADSGYPSLTRHTRVRESCPTKRMTSFISKNTLLCHPPP